MKKLFLSLLLPAAVLITSCNNKEMELKELLTKIENEVKPLRTELGLRFSIIGRFYFILQGKKPELSNL